MSYILEALKKAQAERQLGDTPTINAVSIQVASPAAASARMPSWAILATALVAAAVAAIFWWRQGAPAGEATLVVTPAPPAVLARPAAPVVLAAPAPPQPQPIVVPDAIPAPMAAPAPARPAPQVAAPSARQPAPEEALPFARDLPEQVRSSLPQVVFGGYMYSPNPADRLLLIDKVLRHEGEEVAPGLTLEKLLPKAAVMNFRGTRYRVAY
jgi:general secretion pathway protein B